MEEITKIEKLELTLGAAVSYMAISSSDEDRICKDASVSKKDLLEDLSKLFTAASEMYLVDYHFDTKEEALDALADGGLNATQVSIANIKEKEKADSEISEMVKKAGGFAASLDDLVDIIGKEAADKLIAAMEAKK